MRINLRFFNSVREALGTSNEALDVPADVTTVGAVRQLRVARGGAWPEAPGDGRALRMAFNQQMCPAGTMLQDGCEVAFSRP